jgi:hypothetical protein
MFCWSCIIVYQHNETNVMHFSFNLLRTKGLYMFRALLTHPQEVLHKRHLVYCMRKMSVGCDTSAVSLTLYARYIPSSVCVAPPEDEQVMLETCRGPWFSINWMKSASHWFHCTDLRSGRWHHTRRLEPLPKLYTCLWRWAKRKPETCKAEVNR